MPRGRAAGSVSEPSGELSASIPDGPVLDALLGLVAVKAVAENALGDMGSAVERAGQSARRAATASQTGQSGRKAPRVRRSGRGGLLR